MKKSVKAALLSGLVFPGVGQFSLKRYLRGLVFFVPAMLSLVFIVDSSMRRAFAIAGQIERGDVPLDADAISNLILAAPAGTELLMLNIAQWLLVVCWIISIIDSYRAGKLADQTNSK